MSERTGALELLSDVLEVLSVETGGAVCVCVCWGGGGSSVHEGNVAQSRHKQCLFTSLLLPKWA